MRRVELLVVLLAVSFFITLNIEPSQGKVLAKNLKYSDHPGPWELFLNSINFNERYLSDISQLGDLIWKAGFETGDKSEWCINQSGCGEYNMNASMVKSEVTRERARSGTHSMKMTINTSNGYASTQHWRFAEPNNNKDMIVTVWFFVPQKFDYQLEGWSNIMQWKVEHNNIPAKNTPKSHPLFVIGYGVRGGNGSGGNNFISLSRMNSWFDGYNTPTKIYQPLTNLNIPINQWFRITVRYIHGHNNDGRIMLWQGDTAGNETLLYDIQNVTTYPLRNSDGQASIRLAWSVNLYGDKFKPSILSHFIDDVSFHLPGNPTTTTEPNVKTLNLQSSPANGGKVKIKNGN